MRDARSWCVRSDNERVSAPNRSVLANNNAHEFRIFASLLTHGIHFIVIRLIAELSPKTGHVTLHLERRAPPSTPWETPAQPGPQVAGLGADGQAPAVIEGIRPALPVRPFVTTR